MSDRFRFDWQRAVQREPGLSATAKNVAWALATVWVNADTNECWPGFGAIAAAISRSEDTVARRVKELQAAGWLSVRTGRGAGNKTVLALRMPAGKGVTYADFSVGKNPAKRPEKPRKTSFPYREPTQENRKARADGIAEPWHHGHLRRIPSGGSEEGRWRDWLRREGGGDLSAYQLAQPDGQIIVPLTLPPEAGERTARCIAVGWFQRRAELLGSDESEGEASPGIGDGNRRVAR